MGEVAAIVMAAGKGTRMKSKLPKVLHQICGKPMITHVTQGIRDAGIDDITVIVGHGREQVEEALGSSVKYAYQAEQLGTGHAVLQARDVVDHYKTVLVLSGDTPLLTGDTLKSLVARHKAGNPAVTVLTAVLDNPAGYGRVIRNKDGLVLGIIEDKDASVEQRLVNEINTGTYCFAGDFLFASLNNLRPDNVQKEYYLTDLISLAVNSKRKVEAQICPDPQEIQGINSRKQLADAARIMNRRILDNLMDSGVTIVDPASTYIESGVKIARDTVIYPFTFLQGNTIIGEDCIIGPQTRVIDTVVGNRVTIENSVVKESSIGDDCQIGPFAYLRPGTVLRNRVKIGDFVEIKKSQIDEGSKVPHLSYIGDARIGKNVNIGAGTITCNYDGKNKYNTEVEDGAFIGSNTNLVAPVKVGRHAVVAAGSTITSNVPPKSLGVARSKQVNIDNWVERSVKK